MPILGVDFLSHFHLLIDCSANRLYDKRTRLFTRCYTPQGSQLLPLAPIIAVPQNIPTDVQQLFHEFKSVLSPHQMYSTDSPQQNLTNHTIETTSQTPVFARARQLAPAKLEAAKSEFETMLAAGIIRPSKSPWSSPLHMVAKPGSDKFRPCGDYRRLNSITVPDRYPIPSLSSCSSRLFESTVFSKVDLVKAFYQIPVHQNDIPKTAIITPFGLYEFLFMPFGLRNAAQTFQRHMDSIFRDLPFVFAYIDDLLIFSKSEAEHRLHLRTVLQRLNQHGLHISIEKCTFCVSEIDFLGFRISSEGLLPIPEKVECLENFPKPTDYAGLRRFIGMVNFYRASIPHFANICEPLYKLLGSTNQRNHSLLWNDDAIDAFNKIKEALSQATLLAHNSPSDTYHLVTDASNVAIGAALNQLTENGSKPIAFFSKRLSKTQQAYSAFDRELLAAYLSVLHFKSIIEGRNTHLFTDHKPIVSAFYSQTPAKSDRQQRQLAILSEYISSVEHVKGCENVVADTLSRPINAVQIEVFDLSHLADAQQSDEEIHEYRERLKEYKLPSGKNILCDETSMFPRPYVPSATRSAIFNHLHSMSHPGIKATTRLLTARYFWPFMKRDIKIMTRECLQCQKAKVHRHNKTSPTQPIFPHTDRFQTVHLDIVGPLLPCQPANSKFCSELRYIVTLIDRATRWFECVPVPDIAAQTVAQAFLSGWVSRFGVPLFLVTDQGRQFESALFQELSRVIGFHRLRTSAYRPQTNGMLERFHRTLKSALKAHKGSWLEALPVVQLSLRCIPNDSGFCPFTAVTGATLLLPHVTFKPNESYSSRTVTEYVKTLAQRISEIDFSSLSSGIHNTKFNTSKPSTFKVGDYVWVRIDRVKRPLEAPYDGPYKVLERSNKVVKLELPSGKTSTVSVDRIKLAFLPSSSALLPDAATQVRQSSEPGQSDLKPSICRNRANSHLRKISETAEQPKAVASDSTDRDRPPPHPRYPLRTHSRRVHFAV